MMHGALQGLTGVAGLPGLPRDGDLPVFNDPWEARAFAMVLALHERGFFTWPQWAAALSRQIALAQDSGDADLGDTYYRHWLLALESLAENFPPVENFQPLNASPPP
jgi:nitrile hydratase accessory protein